MTNEKENTVATKNSKKKKKLVAPWYKKPEVANNLVKLPISSIKITEEVHKKGKVSLPLNPELPNTLAVQDNSDGTYTLVAGVNSYIRAKVFDLNVDAYITTDDRKTFKKKYKLHI